MPLRIKQITNYPGPYNLYATDIAYDYSIDAVIDNFTSELKTRRKTTQNGTAQHAEEAADFATRKALGLDLSAPMSLKPFGCTAFTSVDTQGTARMGRNYDFKIDTSSLMVHCYPKDGYESIGFAALSNIGITNPLEHGSESLKLAPFICLDGMNEKGVSVAVLVVEGTPTRQYDTSKKDIYTSLAIRLVLDRAATTNEAVALLQQYNVYAIGGKDYHFYVSDAAGESKVVEFNYASSARETVVTPTNIVTNFYLMNNEYYGHGYERYIAVQRTLSYSSTYGYGGSYDIKPDNRTKASAAHENESVAANTNRETVREIAQCWSALRNSSQEPVEGDPTSNTQWSVLFDSAAKTAEISTRRKWEDVYTFNMHGELDGGLQ